MSTTEVSEPKQQSNLQPALRIANFTYSYAPLMTGISAGVHDRVEKFLEWGHTVRLYRPYVNPSLNIPSSPEGMYGLKDLEAYPDFSSVTFPTSRHFVRPCHPEASHHSKWSDTELLEDFDPDIVLVDEGMGLFGFSSVCTGGYAKPIGVEYFHKTGTPVINLLQTDWLGYTSQLFGKVGSALTRLYLRKGVKKYIQAYEHHLCPSQFLQKVTNDYVGLDDIKHLQLWGINADVYSPENIKYDPIPEIDDPVILYTGRVSREKSVGQLLDAFGHVVEEVPNARLYIFGTGPWQDRLQNRGKKYFGDAVQVPGPCYGHELQGWYARANVYWTASVTENFSTSILESLASGTPVVAAAGGGNVEQIEDGVSGYLVTPGKPKEMAQRTISLLQNEDHLREMSLRARQAALNFDNSVTCARLLDYMRTIIPASKKADIS